MTEVTVGLLSLSASTSLWPGLQLDGRSGRPGLTNRLVAPLLWGCFTRLNWGFLTPEYISSVALVSLRRISREKLTSPLFASVAAKQMVSCAVQTDVTWVNSNNPVGPKAPPPKGAQAGTQQALHNRRRRKLPRPGQEEARQIKPSRDC